MKKVVTILVIVGVLGAAGYLAYQRFGAPNEQPEQAREEAAVLRGSLTSLVNATGTILPKEQTTLTFTTAGTVAEVLVGEGDTVHAGRVLARLDASELEFAVKQAELALATAQVQLLRLQRPPSAYDIAAAEAALESAQSSYRRLQAGPTAEEVQVARANLDQAQAARDQAQRAYDVVKDRPEIGLLPQSLQLQQATIAYEAAKASFELATRKASQAELAAAQSAIRQAEAGLARLQEGVSEEDLIAAQLQVEQAQLSLDQARHRLTNTVLYAPHSGSVVQVGIKPGDLASGKLAFVLIDLSEFHIDISIDEVDVGRISAGQAVTVTLDALPGEVLTGQIERISDVSSVDSGVVTYKATVRLAPSTSPLRTGMTANVDVLTERRDAVLLVPNRFVRVDRTSGKTYVDRLSGGQLQGVEIQIGLRDEARSEVLAGLEEGDVVALVQVSSRDQLRSAFQMGGP